MNDAEGTDGIQMPENRLLIPKQLKISDDVPNPGLPRLVSSLIPVKIAQVTYQFIPLVRLAEEKFSPQCLYLDFKYSWNHPWLSDDHLAEVYCCFFEKRTSFIIVLQFI